MAVSLANTNIFSDEVTCIRKLKQRLDEQLRTGDAKTIPGNSAFLPDGRVLCLERERGDSRFPYGQNGFNFWVCSSGHMHANKGRFFYSSPTTTDESHRLPSSRVLESLVPTTCRSPSCPFRCFPKAKTGSCDDTL